MLSIDLAFYSKIAARDTRREAAKELAAFFEAEDLYIFDYDHEVQRFLPSVGFPQTFPDGRKWQSYISEAVKTTRLEERLRIPGSVEEAQISAVLIHDGLLFCLVNSKNPGAHSSELTLLVQNLAFLLQSERLSKRHEAQNSALRELTNDLKAYSDILSRTRRDLHDALQEARAQKGDLHAFFTQVPAPMVIFLGREHRFHLANPSYVQLVQRDVVGKTLREAFTEEEVGYYLPHLDQVFQTGEPYLGQELPIHLRDASGNIRQLRVNVSYSPFRSAEGAIKGVLVFVENVTAQYTARLKVETLAKEAQLASQAKSQFLANMSHEIRTPMNAILGFSDLLRDPDVSADDRAEFLQRIRANGDHLLALIDDVLDLSRVESGKMSFEKLNFSIVDMVSEIHSSFSLLARGKAIETRLDFGAGIPSVIHSDATRVRQIIMNMVSNAVKFTDSGSVEICVRLAERSKQFVSIEVRDSGIGIPEEVQSDLFKPFRQADDSITRRFGGTGLGLALSRRLADALGGSLELVKSAPGKGSTFRFLLPIGDVEYQSSTLRSKEVPRSESFQRYFNVLNGIKILVAEDSADNRAVIKAYLRSTCADLVFAEDGLDALTKATEENFDLVLMDIQMPKMDGLNATMRLRETGFTMPILALTAHALPEEVKRSLAAGCDDHLIKPVQRDKLIAKILEICFRKKSKELS